jgi:hypothetical protein
MKLVRLSALRAGRLYIHIYIYIFVLSLKAWGPHFVALGGGRVFDMPGLHHGTLKAQVSVCEERPPVGNSVALLVLRNTDKTKLTHLRTNMGLRHRLVCTFETHRKPCRRAECEVAGCRTSSAAFRL